MSHNRTQWTEQNILNWGLDITVDPPQPTVGMKEYHPSAGWGRAPLGKHYPLEKYEYDSNGLVIYKCINLRVSAADSDTDWIIHKLTYDSNSLVTIVQSKVGSYDGRASGW